MVSTFRVRSSGCAIRSRPTRRSGGQEAGTLRDTGIPVIVVTMNGNKSGKTRKIALMRVEHDGEYALVASLGGAPKHPVWYYNLLADPDNVTIQDGPEPFAVTVREVSGDERATWWERSVRSFRTMRTTRPRPNAAFRCSSPPAAPDPRQL